MEIPHVSDNANSVKDSLEEKEKEKGRKIGESMKWSKINFPKPSNYYFNDEMARSSTPEENFLPLSQMSDAPRDIAEYIFITGDEESVVVTISDFLREGIVRFFLSLYKPFRKISMKHIMYYIPFKV